MNTYSQKIHSAHRKKSKLCFPCRTQKFIGRTILQHLHINEIRRFQATAYADKIKNSKEMAIYTHINDP